MINESYDLGHFRQLSGGLSKITKALSKGTCTYVEIRIIKFSPHKYAFQQNPLLIQAERAPIFVINMLTVRLHSNRFCCMNKPFSYDVTIRLGTEITPKY